MFGLGKSKNILRIFSIFFLISTLFLSSVLFITYPLQYSYGQPQNSNTGQNISTSTNISNNTENNVSNNSNILIQPSGKSKFVEPEILDLSELPSAAKEMIEPENPVEEEGKSESYKAKISGEPITGPSSLTRSNITEFDINEIQGIEAATLPSLNQSRFSNNQSSLSNQSLSTSIEQPQIAAQIGFEGLTQLVSGGGYPPDATIAVGPEHVIQMVNAAVQISDKEGNILRTGNLADFFNVDANGNRPCNPCDPFVLYDRSSDRYFASVLNVPDGTIRIASSEPNDPTIPWKTFIIKYSGSDRPCPDQPYIALSSDKLAIGANLYTNLCGEGGRYVGTQHIIINKEKLISQNSTEQPQFFASPRDLTGFSERPVKSFTTTDDIILVSVGTGHNVDRVKMIKYTGQVPNIQSTVDRVGPIQRLMSPPPAFQPSIDIPLDTSGRLQSTSMSPNGDYIWLTSMTECFLRGEPNIPHSCIRLIQFDPNTKEVMQDFNLGIEGLDLLYPSLTVTGNGDMELVFGLSSSNVFPSFAATRQPVESNSTTLDPPILIKEGESFTSACDNPSTVENPTCRYGDYFGASIDADPSDSTNAWVSGQYMLAPRAWGTYITELSP
jgi:hypothetical protein